MRITISSDDKGKVHIDTGDTGDIKPDIKPGLFESTTDVPVIDAGPAPVQEIERTQGVSGAGQVSSLAAAASPEEREAQPLNPLRAGAAASYRDPANLRKKAADVEGTFAVAQQQFQQQQPSATTFDGGAAQVSESKEAPGAAEAEQQSSKRAKRDRKR